MDAFSLSLIYGTLNLNHKKTIELSVIVGLFHFFMPLIGLVIGDILIKNIILEPFHLVSIIFLIIGLQMILSDKRKRTQFFTKLCWFLVVWINSKYR
jgi:putative Mn2+ efflux pump MntP